MSQIAEKLYQVCRGISQPLGFRAGTTSKALPMLLIAVPPKEMEQQGWQKSEIFETGELDGLLICLDNLEPPNLARLSEISNSIKNIPWGVWLNKVSSQEVNRLSELSSDFVIFEATATAKLLQENKLGKFLQINPPKKSPDFLECLFRIIEQLSVDAVLFDSGEDFLTVSALISCYQLSALLSKPLLLALSAKLTEQEIQMLWRAGVDGLVIREAKSIAELSRLAQAVKSLPPASRKQRQEVFLPYLEGEKI